MRSSTANLATASTAGAWHTLMMLGELLRLDGVAGREGVVFSGAGSGSLGASCLAMYRSKSACYVFFSPYYTQIHRTAFFPLSPILSQGLCTFTI